MAGHNGLAKVVSENIECDVPIGVLIPQRQFKPREIIKKAPFGFLDAPPEHDIAW